MKKLISIIILGIIIGLGFIFSVTEEIPKDFELKAPRADILQYRIEGNIVTYLYKDKLLEALENEIVSKRTSNTRYFKSEDPQETIMEVSIGQPYYQDKNNEWYYLNSATTTAQYFSQQTKLAWWEKLLGKEALADTIDEQVGASADDAHQIYSTCTIDADFQNLGSTNRWVGLRFTPTIAQGSTISSAYITAVCYENMDADIWCEDVDNAAQFTTDNNNISGRTPTTATATWTEGSLSGWANSPSLVSLVQEVVNRESWSSGNGMNFLFQGRSDDYCYIYFWDYSVHEYAPKLHIEYTIGGDTAPPVRSNGSPSGTLAAGTTQTTISLATNENATCKYGTVAGTTYNSLPNTFSTTGGTSHSATVTGLTDGTIYNYYVRCQDTASPPNQNIDDFTISFSIATSMTPTPGRPSLYFTLEEIPQLKALKTAPSHSIIYNNIKTWADPRVNDAPPGEMLDQPQYYRDYMTAYIGFYIENMTFMYYMTDDTEYLNAAKTWLLDFLNWSDWGAGFVPMKIARTTAFGYDALYDYLTEAERTNLRNMMIERIDEFYQLYTGWRGIWSWDYPATLFDVSGAVGMAGLALKGDWSGADDWIDFAVFNSQRGLNTVGRDGETHDGGHAYQAEGLEYLVPFINALKRINGQDLFAGYHLDQVGQRFAFWMYNGYGLQFDDAFWGIDLLGWAEVDGYRVSRQGVFFYLLASKYSDGYSQWFADNYAVQYRMLSYIWKDPNITPTPPNNLPLTKYFRDNGYVIWRSGWGNSDLLFAFKSGNAWGHVHPSQNSFGIYYQGKPITAGGGYWLEIPTWPHNVILVNGDGNSQVDDSRDVAQILTVEEKSPYYRYLLGDATAPYQGKLDKWLRHVVFMEPNYFVMYDEVAASTAKQFDWLLHAPYLAGDQGSTPSLSLSGDLITLNGSGGGQLKVKIMEPQNFNSEIISYYNDQSVQCYYAKVRPSTNQSSTQFLNVFFPSTVLSTDRISTGNLVGVKVTDGSNIDLILFSRDGNPVNEYVDLGGGYFQALSSSGTYSFESTGVRVIFDTYLVLRLQSTGSPTNNPPVIYSTGTKTVRAGETLQFTVSGFDPDNDSLTYSASYLPSGASFNPSTQTFTWTPTNAQAGTYNIRFQVSAAGGTDSIETDVDVVAITTPSTYGLVGYWDFNEGSGNTASDQSGYNNTGTLKNGPQYQYVNERSGYALQFDGVNDYVEVPNSSSLNITDALTIEAWVKPTKRDSTLYNYFVSKSPGYMLFIRDDLITFFYLDGVYNWYDVSGKIPNYFDGNWHQIVGTYNKDGGVYKMRLYLDGQLYHGASQFLASGSIGTAASPLLIGHREGEYSAGLIDEVKIWNRALTEAEIKASYTYKTTETTEAAPPSASFTLSSTNQLYLFRDQANSLSITGSNFDLSTDFSIQFLQNSNVISSFTAQSTNGTTFTLNLTSTQTNTLPIGFYDLKVLRVSDNESQIHTKQILITQLGDLWSSTATEASEQKRDGQINLYDVSRMLSKWGSTNSQDLQEADINPGPSNVSQDKIDLYDANLIMKNWSP